ncbi:MAG: tetratricopeptide repeat protein [Acidobacteria bacterium]|nr:tetratricopeptide repeat protein [Acidobacteriota bacterium]
MRLPLGDARPQRLHAGDLEAAAAHARQATVVDPDFWIAHYHLGQAYEQLGQTDRALDALERAAQLSQHGHSKALSVRGYILGKIGRRAEAAEILNTLAQTATTRYVPAYASALVYAGMGEREAAFQWLDKGLCRARCEPDLPTDGSEVGSVQDRPSVPGSAPALPVYRGARPRRTAQNTRSPRVGRR